MDNNIRYNYIDVVKGIAMSLVVMGHVLSGCKSEEMLTWNEMNVWSFIYSFHMPLFMFVSGFVCFNPHKNYSLKSVLKRCISYLIPFFFIAFILGSLRGDIRINQLWYFRTLVIFIVVLYICMNIVRKIIKNSTINGIVICLTFLVVIKLMTYYCQKLQPLDTLLDYSHLVLYVFFGVGYLLRHYINYVEKILIHDYTLVVTFLLTMAFYIYLPISITIKQFCMILFVVNVCSLNHLLQQSFLREIGRNTKVIYIIHFFFLIKIPVIGNYFLEFKSMSTLYQAMPQLIYSIPVTALTIYGSLKLSKIIRCSPMLSLLALGNLDINNKK